MTDRFYPTRAELAEHVAQIIRGELLTLAREGVPYLQLDAPYYSTYLDEDLREGARAAGMDPDQALLDAVRVDNLSLEGVARPGLTVAMHVCRGTRAAAGWRRAATSRSPRRFSAV